LVFTEEDLINPKYHTHVTFLLSEWPSFLAEDVCLEDNVLNVVLRSST